MKNGTGEFSVPNFMVLYGSRSITTTFKFPTGVTEKLQLSASKEKSLTLSTGILSLIFSRLF